MAELTIKDLLGIDFDDKGLAETIDSVTKNDCERFHIHELIGVALFHDGGILEDEATNPNGIMKRVSFYCDDVMSALCLYAASTPSFIERLK